MEIDERRLFHDGKWECWVQEQFGRSLDDMFVVRTNIYLQLKFVHYAYYLGSLLCILQSFGQWDLLPKAEVISLCSKSPRTRRGFSHSGLYHSIIAFTFFTISTVQITAAFYFPSAISTG